MKLGRNIRAVYCKTCSFPIDGYQKKKHCPHCFAAMTRKCHVVDCNDTVHGDVGTKCRKHKVVNNV